MAVSITRKDHIERGTFYEIGLSESGDAVQAHIVRTRGQKPINWFNGNVSWYKTAAVAAWGSNGSPDDMEIDKDGNGVTGKSWQSHAETDSRQAVETEPLTGLRFKASAAGQQVVLWTGAPLLDGYLAEVGGV